MDSFQVFRIPKVQSIFSLALIALSTLFYYPFPTISYVIAASLIFTVVSELIFLFLRRHSFYPPYSAIITGLILGLTVNPHVPWYGILLIATLASASKNFLRLSGRHIFNPAAIGLIAGNILLHGTVSWWGASFQIFSLTPLHIVIFVLLLFPFYVSGIRMKRFGSIGSFLIVYSVLLYIQKQTSPIRTFMDPTVLFFALVMLPEPMTSPHRLRKQILFGGFVAIAAILFFYLPFSRNIFAANLVPDGLLPFLLIGNIIFFKYR